MSRKFSEGWRSTVGREAAIRREAQEVVTLTKVSSFPRLSAQARDRSDTTPAAPATAWQAGVAGVFCCAPLPRRPARTVMGDASLRQHPLHAQRGAVP